MTINITARPSVSMKQLLCVLSAALLSSSATAFAATAPTDGEALRAELRQHYPSLAWVERYRQAYPTEALGNDALLRGAPAPALETVNDLFKALTALQDQHVAVAGPKAGKQESLGVLFRTSSDGAMSVWRIIDPAITALHEGEQVSNIDGQPVARWLEQAAVHTFGGNRRSRMAEAALKLGISTPTDHAAVGLANKVRLDVRGSDGATRTVELAYLPASAQTGAALAHAVERSDLPESVQALGYRVGIVRFGAFAPQYDAEFNTAAEAAEQAGGTGDGPMLAGFCAVVRKQLAHIDALAARSDMLLIDLRGNLGGFARETRLLALALTAKPLPHTYDVFPGSAPGRLKLVPQVDDASCGTVATPRPLVVWTDAGTRSAGEFMATWLWGAGAIAVGERTIGAGGGRDSEAAGFVLPRSGLRVKYSGNFSVFDNGVSMKAEEVAESTLLDLVAQDRFAPSRTRPFAIQAVGLMPDLPLPTTAADLSDGGAAALQRLVGQLVQRQLLAPKHGGGQ
ncbi:hypothetical protein Jab_2c00260 [Janthinobacterium sp. HH01]|uniref:S41 family peptidase n=1 Tax=Janthinobacterium sp. HH01 TaxID=1198452 RepID=UPI0002AED25F|nr:S41 family peptidase [Janthinobacterium sp. HH01]ELX07985.1 hypothetical protein Jab_2c00260 [Janthinobacterium sp. HH01]